MGFFSKIAKPFEDLAHGLTGKTAGEAAKEGSQISAQAQREQLAYLKEINKLPQQYKEQALAKLSGAYGLGGDEAQEEFFSGLKTSPIYEATMGGRDAGEEAIMRNAGATGGLRSGNVQDALSRYSGDLENEAFMRALNFETGGLSGLSGIDAGSSQIANTIGGIGKTLGQGVTAAGQAESQGMQNLLQMGLMGGSLFI